MRWFVQGNVTPAAAEALRRHEHTVTATSPADALNRSELLSSAIKQQLDLLTGDSEMIEFIYSEGAPRFARSVVYLQLAGADVEQDDAIDRLFKRYKRLSPGRLYTVTGTRVKVRQLPTGSSSANTAQAAE